MSAGGRRPDRWRWPRRLAFAVLIPAVLFLGLALLSPPGSRRGVKHARVVEQLHGIAGAARLYRTRTGHWPDAVATLRQARLLPRKLFPTWAEDRDPWARPFVLTPKGADLEVRSLGVDGADPDDDVAIVVKAASP